MSGGSPLDRSGGLPVLESSPERVRPVPTAPILAPPGRRRRRGRATHPWYVVVMRHDDLAVLDQINALLDRGDDSATVNTSMRLPANLRDAAALAVERLGVARSTTTLTAAALRSALETAVMEAALEAHFGEHPHARPTLAEVALAAAAQDGSPLVDHPAVIEQAAIDVLVRHPDADADDVLLWVEAQRAVSA